MESDQTKRFGFRLLNVTSWLHVDPAWAGTVMSSSRKDPSEAWVHDVCEVRLEDHIPDTLQRLFEVARGSYAYSLMFYPLLTLGAEPALPCDGGCYSPQVQRSQRPRQTSDLSEPHRLAHLSGNHLSRATTNAASSQARAKLCLPSVGAKHL